ncbi:hypothetical protein B0H17DRAFT_1169735 [Mycena rosella]|uniref:Uncharacterized protein n=1 Tax=Mycena rosella TaxID=1033263 RepID=A0AAD7D9W1_MYCRO|nr:hypothetical protein B0H17DRAFT_1169735 [Mycena rosella]
MSGEEVIPRDYTYAWTVASDLPLPDFLEKYKPSVVQNNGKKPWIWVRGGPRARDDAGKAGALREGGALLKEIIARVKQIKDDASIPLQPNKQAGVESKKQVREQVQAEAAEKFTEIATRNGWVSGKWMIFAPVEKVDVIWADLATSLVSGPLAATCAFMAKVATASAGGISLTSGHLICLYVPDVYDKPGITQVMSVLARYHGIAPISVKANMFGALGIDSKHPSGVQTSPWKYAELMTSKEFKALKKDYNADVKAKKLVAPAKAKPPPRKKFDDEPFVPKAEVKTKKRKQVGSDPDYEDDGGGNNSADADYEEVEPKRMRTGAE